MSGFLQRIEQLLDHRPVDVERAAAALTHPSYLHQHPDAGSHNQRLEFLGDAVLGLVVAEIMFRRLGEDEGQLTRARSAVVSTSALAGAARRLMLGDLLRMSDAAQRSGDNQRDKVLADAFEAMVALAYEELGLDGARAFVARHLEAEIEAAAQGGATTEKAKCKKQKGKKREESEKGEVRETVSGIITPAMSKEKCAYTRQLLMAANS